MKSIKLKWYDKRCLLGRFFHQWVVFWINFYNFLGFSLHLGRLFLWVRVRLTLTLALLFLFWFGFFIFQVSFPLLSLLSFLGSFFLCCLFILLYFLMVSFIQFISYFPVVQYLNGEAWGLGLEWYKNISQNVIHGLV